MARIMALDPGTKRCGIAISDSSRTMAFPRPALAVNEDLIFELRRFLEEETVDLIVVGRPVALSGNETASTISADELYRQLCVELSPLPVLQWDERLTTTQAQRSLTNAGLKVRQHRQKIDSAAAVVMLQNYLDGQRVE